MKLKFKLLISILVIFCISIINLRADWTNKLNITNNKLNDIINVSGDIFVAIGDYGTIIRTTDNGASWTQIELNTKIKFNSISSTGQIVIAVGGMAEDARTSYIRNGTRTTNHAVIYRSTDSGLNWVKIGIDFGGNVIHNSRSRTSPNDPWNYNVGGTSLIFSYWNSFKKVRVFDNGLGFILSDNGNIYSTDNFGQTWFILPELCLKWSSGGNIQTRIDVSSVPSITSLDVMDIFHYNSFYYLIHNTHIPGTNTNKTDIQILRSSDGIHWETYNSINDSWFLKVFNINDDLYFISPQWESSNVLFSNIYSYPNILTTTTPVSKVVVVENSDTKIKLYDVQKRIYGDLTGRTINYNNEIYFGTINGNILKLNSSGIVTTTLKSHEEVNLINSIAFNANGVGLAVGNNGLILKRENNSNWQTINNYKLNLLHFNAVDFPNNGNLGWAVGDRGIIYHSTNKGDTWVKQETFVPIIQDFKDIKMRIVDSKYEGIIVGENGIIVKTTNGGWPWYVVNEGNQTYQLNKILYHHDNSTNQDFIFAISEDAAENYTTTPTTIYNYNRIMRSADNGRSWINIHSATSPLQYKISSVSNFISLPFQGRLFDIKSEGSNLYICGVTEKRRNLNTSIIPFTSEISSKGIEREVIFKSIDGGSSWEQVNDIIPTATHIQNNLWYRSLAFLNTSKLYVGGEYYINYLNNMSISPSANRYEVNISEWNYQDGSNPRRLRVPLEYGLINSFNLSSGLSNLTSFFNYERQIYSDIVNSVNTINVTTKILPLNNTNLFDTPIPFPLKSITNSLSDEILASGYDGLIYYRNSSDQIDFSSVGSVTSTGSVLRDIKVIDNLASTNVNNIISVGDFGAITVHKGNLRSFNKSSSNYTNEDNIKFNIFPNPALDLIKFKVPANEIIEVNIINLIGDKQLTKFIDKKIVNGEYEYTYDVSDYLNGVYYLEILLNNKYYNAKFVKN